MQFKAKALIERLKLEKKNLRIQRIRKGYGGRFSQNW